MSGLVKYEAARYALSEAVRIDDVKDMRDKAQAMAAYARQAKDTDLMQWAAEIKVRAERKAGQMLAEMDMNKGAATRSHDVTASPKTLDEIGITKNESSRWQKVAAVSDTQFEDAVTAARETAAEITTAAMIRIEKENKKANTANIGKANPAAESTKPAYFTPFPDPFNDDQDQATPVEQVAVSVSVELAAEVHALREQLAEIAENMESTLADNNMMGRVFDSDDRIKAALIEVERYRAIADNAERTLASKSGEFKTRADQCAMWMGRAQRAEKKLEKYEAKK